MVNPVRGLQSTTRVTSVDARRGLVMIIMVLDHTREFFHVGAMSFSPVDLARTTPVLFFTRWLTHICAPVFMFSAGLGAFCSLGRGQLTRGLAVIALGSCFGRIMTMDPVRRGRWMVRIGLGLTLAFLVVRGINVYGDPNPWSQVPGMTVLSFMRCAKYPPSLDFLLMTL